MNTDKDGLSSDDSIESVNIPNSSAKTGFHANFILYVRDQKAASDFYAFVLGLQPTLNVPGMTEFTLGHGVVLGLMPEAGIRRLLGTKLPDPAAARGIPRSELYLRVDDPDAMHARAARSGAMELSPMLVRDWGDRAAYSLDPDGHVLAFAAPVGSNNG
ncbi:MAG: glyoxalase [Candidatus Riflebacteria bacterium]|nr:glyoxalase [Candidatus Riflebacteria bacterium]